MPPACGIMAPSSAQTSPSQSPSSAPTTHPSSARLPWRLVSTSGIVTNGPIPTIVMILTATAPRRPSPRITVGGFAFSAADYCAWQPPTSAVFSA